MSNEDYKGPRWQLYRFDPNYPYRYYSNIPYWMKEHVCVCKEFRAFDLNAGRLYPTCKDCGGLLHYLIHKCTSCDEIFLKCFSHIDYCNVPSCIKCWDCIQTAGPCTIDFHQRKVPFDDDIRPPIFKAPRKFSREELESFDIFA